MALANVFAKLPKPGTGSYALCFCVFSLESVFSLQSSPLAVLRRLVCAADNNAGVKTINSALLVLLIQIPQQNMPLHILMMYTCNCMKKRKPNLEKYHVPKIICPCHYISYPVCPIIRLAIVGFRGNIRHRKFHNV